MDAMPVTTTVSIVTRFFYSLISAFKGVHVRTVRNDGPSNGKGTRTCTSWEEARDRHCVKGLEASFFKTSNYLSFKEEIPEPVYGTCGWFLDHERYVQWRDNAYDDLLWLTADPLCGKSVLSSALFSRLATIESSATLHFFFSKDNEKQQSGTSALCAFVHQLFSLDERLFATHGMRAYSLHGDSLNSDFDALWNLLLQILRNSGLQNVFCILDGLDECQSDDRYRLIRKLKDFCQNWGESSPSSQGTSVKFFVTSRPYLDVESNFNNDGCLPPVVRLAAEHQVDWINTDVEIVARARMKDVGRSRMVRPEVQDAALSMVLENDDTTYLWQKYIFQAISDRNPGSLDEWKAVINQLPPPVEDICEDMLSQSPDRHQAMKILKIIVAATRPLTLTEMDIALAVEGSPGRYDDLQLCGDDYIATHIRYICGLFLKIVDARVYLIHVTAESYLLGKAGHLSKTWKGCLDPSDCHLTLATICVRYLLRGELRVTLSYEGSEGEAYKLRAYAMCNWAAHYRESGVNESHPLTTLVSELYSRSNKWWIDNIKSIPGPKPFYREQQIADMCYNGHDKILGRSKLQDKSKDILWNGLRLATIEGHTRSVQLLLKAWPHKDGVSRWKLDILLHIAVWYGHEGLVRALFAKGASVNSYTDFGCTALYISVLRGNEKMVKLLVDAGAGLEVVREGWQTPLLAAVEKGFEKVVEVLLEAGANLGAYHPDVGTALHIVARSANPRSENPRSESMRIVNMLLDAGIDANVETPSDGTALHLAALYWKEELVDVLRKVSDINVRSRGYWKALTFMSMHGDANMVALLLQLAPDSNHLLRDFKYRRVERDDHTYFERREAKDAMETFRGVYRTILKRASARGDAKMVSLLLGLARGAPVDVLGINPALRMSAANGYWSVVEVFLRISDVSVNVWGKQYGCALHAAAWGGHKDVAEKLISKGAKTNAQNEHHGTPLYIAAMRGHKDVVELLMRHRDTLNVPWQDHGSPLYAAAEHGHIAVIEALLEEGADANITGGQFGTPLQAAKEASHPEIVKLLINAKQKQANGKEQIN